MKKVVLLGSTGSIGTSTVKVAEDLPDQIRLIGLAAGGNSELLLAPNAPAPAGGHLDCRARQGGGRSARGAGHFDPSLCRRRRFAQTGHPAGGGHCPDRHRGHGRVATGAGGHSRGQRHRRRVQGNPGHGRRNRHERGAQTWRARAGGGQRTFGDFSMSGRQAGQFGAPAYG